MQLTRFTDYSLRVLMYLSAYPERLCTISEIAESYEISENHLMKVVSRLAATGYVDSIRGKGGGIRLARPPKLINLGAVVRDMEERFDIVECFNEEKQDCPLLPACTLKSILHDASRNFLATLDRHTVQDVLGNGLSAMFAIGKANRVSIKALR
jgi:Rrf2 family nitric oxide-sensitive transcriptional repressor